MRSSTLPVTLLLMLTLLCCPVSSFFCQQLSTTNQFDVEPTATSTSLPTNTLPAETPAHPLDATDPLSRTYDVHQIISLINEGPGLATRISLRVALIQTLAPFQEVNTFTSSVDPDNFVMDRFGNHYAEIKLTDIQPGEIRKIKFSYRVQVNKITFVIDQCHGEKPNTDREAELYIESDAPEIVQLAEVLSQGSPDDCQTARNIYDYVVSEISYSQYNPQDIGALTTLRLGEGDCTEFSDLLIALNRAAGIPARFLEGITCCTTMGYQPGEIKHNWAEIFLPGTGWVPMDPTWGRFLGNRELYFAAMTPDHIILTRGRNLDFLNGYHYYAYQYWWDSEATTIHSEETWSILLANGQ